MGAKQERLTQKLNEVGVDFEIGLFEKIVERDPGHIEALSNLGNNYTLRGDFQRGLEIDRRLAALRPKDPIVHYNLACSYSLLGRLDEAIASLERAITLGYRDFEFIQRDRDLKAIREDARFQRIVERLTRV